MSSPKDGPGPHPVDDAEAAFHKLEDFTRKILAVPKKRIEQKVSREKKKRTRGGR